MKRKVALDPRDAAPILRDASPALRRRIRLALRALAADPAGENGKLDIRELRTRSAGSRVFRLRVGEWRIAFLLRGDAILVLRIFHRRDGYGWLERL